MVLGDTQMAAEIDAYIYLTHAEFIVVLRSIPELDGQKIVNHSGKLVNY